MLSFISYQNGRLSILILLLSIISYIDYSAFQAFSILWPYKLISRIQDKAFNVEELIKGLYKLIIKTLF